MLPKILRIRFFAVSRVSRAGAGAALVAMWVCRLCLCSPAKAGAQKFASDADPGRAGKRSAMRQDAKSRGFSPRRIAASASYETSVDQCVERAARRRALFRKTVVRGAI